MRPQRGQRGLSDNLQIGYRSNGKKTSESVGYADDAGRHALAGEWGLDQNNRQGWYGECFVQALAGAAGLQCSRLVPDCTGVDFAISSSSQVGYDFPCVMVQVKSWSVPRERDASWRYDGLTQKHFNALVGPLRVPRFLFLVIVPPDAGAYAHADEHALRLSNAAYWVSLHDQQPFSEPTPNRRVPVLVPKSNLLTAATLRGLCEDVGLTGRRVS